MQLLKIENNQGAFLGSDGTFKPVDSITKDDLLRLVDSTLTGEAAFDAYDEEMIKNPAHQIVYKSVYEKLRELKERKQEFIDESERTYLADYEKYKGEA
jgi:hypothetical protein